MTDRICSIEGCVKASRCRGWCDKHYAMWRIHGDPLASTRRPPRPCSIEFCESMAVARGWCKVHYYRWKKTGDPVVMQDTAIGNKWLSSKSTPDERFWAKVQKTETCWLWVGALNDKGYGIFRFQGTTRTAHRTSLVLAGIPFMPGLVVDHLCRVRNCVNPAHLEQVTTQTNVLRGVGPAALHAKKTHCPSGHPYDEANTYLWRGKWRICRTCRESKMY